MKLRNLIIKDLSVMLSDKQAFVIILLMPMILMMILGLSLGSTFSSNGFNEPIKIAIIREYDKEKDLQRFEDLLKNYIEDDEEVNTHQIIEEMRSLDIEKNFFQDFLENEDLKEILTYEILDKREAEERLKTGEIATIVLLPENFIYDLSINFVTPFKNEILIEIIQHPNNSMKGNVVESIMEGFFDRISAIIISKNVFIETAIEEKVGFEVFDELEILLRKTSEDFVAEKVKIDDMAMEDSRRINGFDYYAVAMLSMFTLFLASIESRNLYEEGNRKTLQRTKVSGISMKSIVLSQYITVFLMALFQIITMILYSSIVMKVDWGSYSTVGVLIIAHAFAIASLSAFISSIILKLRSIGIANLFESVIIPIMAFIGGSFIHYSILPKFIEKISFFTINGLTIRGYINIMLGYGIGDILNYILGLVLISIILLTISIVIFQKRGEGIHVDNYQAKNIEIKG